MIDVKNTLIKNNYNAKKTSEELGIGETIIRRHLPSMSKRISHLEKVDIPKEKPKKRKKLKALKVLEVKKKHVSGKINYFEKKIGEIKYFATNKERLDHADDMINRDWL